MKKYIFVFTILLAIGFISNTLFAQLTVSSITVVNTTNCVLSAEPSALDLTCSHVCKSQVVNVNPHSAVAVPFPCAGADALSGGYYTIVGIFDPATNSGVKVGNGCGVNLSGTFKDCQGITRTATFIAPNTVNIQ